MDQMKASESPTASPFDSFEGLSAAWEGSLRRAVADAPDVSVLFSGGIDSAYLAWSLKRRVPLELVTVGTEHAPDLERAGRVADRLALPWTPYLIGEAEVREALYRYSTSLKGVSGPARSVAIAFALALERTRSARVLCGQGADELFLGYAHFRGLSPEELAPRATEDLRRLETEDWPRAEALARANRRELRAPYLDPDVRAMVGERSWAELRPADQAKPFLRRWAIASGFPSVLAEEPKRAFQYGSGVDRILRRFARRAILS